MNSVLDLQNLIQGFKLSCQTENKSPKTIEWYTCFLEKFLQFLNSRFYPVNIDEIDKHHIREFIRYLQLEAKTPHQCKPLSQHGTGLRSHTQIILLMGNKRRVSCLQSYDEDTSS